MIMPALAVIGGEHIQHTHQPTSMKDPKYEAAMMMNNNTGYTHHHPNHNHNHHHPGAHTPHTQCGGGGGGIHQTVTTSPNSQQQSPMMECSDYNSNIDPNMRTNCMNTATVVDTNNLNTLHGDTKIHIEDEVKKMVSSHREVCCGCGQPIQDRYLLRVVDNYWHEQCLRCSMCSQTLTASCFVKDGQLLCRNDYARFYGVKCSRCCQSIPANDFVMRAMDNIYHLQCFSCVMCGYQLQKGDQFVVKEANVYCRMDYEKEFMFRMEGDWFPSYHPGSDCDSLMDGDDGDGSKGPKRPRTILTTSQRRKFKASFEINPKPCRKVSTGKFMTSFEINPKPCRKVREALAAETGLSVRVVQVWFQNQRAKMKKIARKQQQNKDSQNGKKTSPKDDKDDSDSESDSEPSTKSCKNLSESTDLSEQPLSTTPGPTSLHPGHHTAGTQGGHCGGVGGGVPPPHQVHSLEDVFMNQASQHNTATNNCNHGPVVNPIDKLYSMQTSYFSQD